MQPNFARLLGIVLLGSVFFVGSSADGGWGYGHFYHFHHHPRWGGHGYGWAHHGFHGSHCPIYGCVAPAAIVCNASGCGVGVPGTVTPRPAPRPATGQPPVPSPAPAGMGPSTTRVDHTSAELVVTVPPEASVFVNGQETQIAGAQRRFFSRGLRPGGVYAYEVRAEMVRNGRMLTETRRVEIPAGGRTQVSFAFTGDTGQLSESNPVTTVIVHVPADAQVFLEGRDTGATGSVRRFSTTQLPASGVWNNYSIRAAIRREGRLIELERTVSLAAGQSRQVTFDFDAQRVADVTGVSR
jgi:uncharacterized protein (TIGR03000 family)